MRKHITIAAALLGVALLLAPAAEAGDREGRSARGSRGGAAPVRSRSSSPRRAPSPFSRSRSSRPRVGSPFTTGSQRPSQQALGSTRSTSGGALPWSARRPSPFSRSNAVRTRSTWTAPSSRSATQGRGSAPSLLTPRSRSPSAAASPRGALDRLRTRTPTTRSGAGVGNVANRRISPSSAGDTGRSTGSSNLSQRFGARRSGISGLNRPVIGPSALNRNATSRSQGLTTRRVGSTRIGSSRVGSRSGSSRFGARAPLGTTRSTGALVSGGVRTRGAVSGSVRTRPGTRGRVGRSYRIASHGHHHHGSSFGFYYAWNPYYVPYYRAYPRYGLYFGYGLTWYGPSYSTVFVDAVDYYPSTQVIVEKEIVEVLPAQPAAPALEPAVPGEFPAPAPQAEETQAHPDFEPAVQDFLGGRYQSALQRLDRVLAAQPDNGEAWLAAMHANFVLGQYGRAGLALARAAALDAFPRGYRFDPRPLYAQTGNFDRAVKALEDHMRRNRDDADAMLVRAYLHVALGERAAAQDRIQRVLEVRPADETAPALAMALLPPPPPPAPAPDGR